MLGGNTLLIPSQKKWKKNKMGPIGTVTKGRIGGVPVGVMDPFPAFLSSSALAQWPAQLYPLERDCLILILPPL